MMNVVSLLFVVASQLSFASAIRGRNLVVEVEKLGKSGKGGCHRGDIQFWQPDGDIFVNPASQFGDSVFEPKTVGPVDKVGLVAILDVDLYDAETRTTVIGHVTGTCTRVEVGKKWICFGTYEFLSDDSTTYPTGDSINVSGPFYDNSNVWNAIQGGTGCYESAEGQAYYDITEPNWNLVTMHLD